MKRQSKKRWIQKGIKRPGRVTEAAKRDGLSVPEEARKMSHSSDPSKRGAGNLALRFEGKAKHGNLKKRGKKRSKGRSSGRR